MSRNVKKVTFVEKNVSAFNILNKNINKLKVNNKVNIKLQSVEDYISKFSKNDDIFDLIFLDPPFKDQNIYSLFELIEQKKIN